MPKRSAKTVITSDTVGFGTTGVLPIQRLPGITPEARQPLTIKPGEKPKK